MERIVQGTTFMEVPFAETIALVILDCFNMAKSQKLEVPSNGPISAVT
jgi:hypothetical protein